MVKMLRNLLGVEKMGKPSRRNAGDLFAPTDVSFNLGTIRYVGEELQSKFSVGQKVYIGNQREELRIEGIDIMVMEEKNVIAIVEDSHEEAQSEASES